MIKHCEICGERIEFANSRITVCRGKYVNGKLIRSQCDKQRRRLWKRYNKEAYRKGGKYARKKVEKEEDIHRYLVTNNCLKCGKDFQATSKHNRVCTMCTRENNSLTRPSHNVLINGRKGWIQK